VLTGRVLQQGETLIVQADLINVAEGAHIWGEKYSRKLSDILAVQEEIAKHISETLRFQLTGQEQQQLTKRYTENTEAYQLYLKGRYFWNKRTEEGLKKAIEYFQRAMDRDPNYALAYAGLADCYAPLVYFGYLRPKQAWPRAKAAAMKALEIEDTLAEAHTALAAVIQYYDWDRLNAEKSYKRAIELNPNYSTAHHWYAQYLIHLGRIEEGLAESKRAQELDPLSLIINSAWAERLNYARQYDRAIEQLQKTLELDPNFAHAHWQLGRAYEQKGMYEEAIAELQKAITLSGSSPVMVAALGHAYAVSGKSGKALKILDELKASSQRSYIPPSSLAAIDTGLGQKDQAFAWLQKAYEERDMWLGFLKVDPDFDSLRSDPRFEDLLRRIGLQ
jgi:tetratricopeptide (TPR) repeat protein